MRPSQAVHLHRSRIRQIALGHRVRDVRVFGSVPAFEAAVREAAESFGA